MYDRLAKSVCNALKGQKRKSLELRLLRAVLYEGTNYSNSSNILNLRDLKFAKGQPETQAKMDFQALSSGKPIEKKIRSYSHKSENVIKKAVDFILSEQFTVPISYGTHMVTVGKDDVIKFPNIMRKQNRTHIVNAYLSYDENDADSMCRNSMFKIVNSITTTDEVVLSAIDYVTSLLVNDTCETLQKMISACLLTSQRDSATKLVLSARNFLKHQYSDHVTKSDDDICFHGIDYGLRRSMPIRTSHNCSHCKFSFYVCNQLNNMVFNSPMPNQEMISDACKVISDTSKKFKLFMGRALN